MVRDLIFIYDYICPYCYLMFREVREIERKKDVRVFWVPVELFPQTPSEGVLLEKAIGIRQKNKIEKKVSMLAKKQEIPYYQPSILYNTHLAMLLTDFVSIQTNGERTAEVIEELFNRVFVYNENIGDWNILYKVCMNLALDFERFREAAAQPHLQNVNAEWKKQYAKKDMGALPAFLIETNITLQGLYMYEELENFIK